MSAGGAARWAIRGLAAVGLLSVAWCSYVVFTPEASDALPERISDHAGALDPRERAVALAANLEAPLLEGNRIELLENGVEIFPAMLGAIRAARESITFLTYVYWTGDVAREFAAELAAACRRGVETRVLLDAFGAAKMNEALVRIMEDAGCDVAMFHPLHWYTLRRLNNRTHRKVLVVDGRIGFTGGVGIAEEWTGDAQDPDHWRDDHFRVEGPAVRFLQGAFAENWREATGEVLVGPRLFPDLDAAGKARVVPLLESPGQLPSKTALLYWLSIQGAERKIHITTPYFIPEPRLVEALANAARRGVDVMLLVPNHHNDVGLARYAGRTFYRELLEAGARVFEYQPTMIHVKAVTVDDGWAIVGSSNFDNRSFELNFEIVLAVEDEALVADLDRSFGHDLARSREITLEDVERWSAVERARDWASRALRKQL